MSDIAIKVENLSKLYKIGSRQGNYRTLRDTLAGVFTAPFRWLKNAQSAIRNPQSEYVWALKDVSFEIKRGEVVGIIGRNGAGKSTLLKILSRISEPTEGCAKIHGRSGSLLEVGTGFHQELTGRENIYLSGGILGMKKAEIMKRFEEIVAFAEIEKFIDTPVKHYSSGMYVRLAFSVAACLESEIIFVDEVLAVGDVGFQKKCLGRMVDIGNSGRTILFISHQMNQIRRLCNRALWLDLGRIKRIGITSEVVSAYEGAISSIFPDGGRHIDSDHFTARFLKWEIEKAGNGQPNVLTSMGPVKVKFILKISRSIKNGHHGIALFNSDNQLIWATAVYHLDLEPGICAFQYELPFLPIRPGVYYWNVSLYDDGDPVDVWWCSPEMIVATEPIGHPLDVWQGFLNLPWHYSVRKE
jgi:lipopolysaccharide transport system ATP-binding protein